MNIPFIDIHTHKLCAGNTVCIRNVFVHELDLLADDKCSYFSAGIHPWQIDKDDPLRDWTELVQCVGKEKVLAIGEAGLDKNIDTPLEIQKEVFMAQVRLAEEIRKPFIIHCVKAYSEILAIRKQINAQMIWIFHGFQSSLQMAHQIIDHGCMLSFGANILKEHAKTIEVLSSIGDEHFFFETDEFESGIDHIYKRASEIRKLTIDQLLERQSTNFRKVFSK